MVIDKILMKIYWTPAAKNSYQEVLEYLLQNWTQKEIDKLIMRTEKVLSLLVKNPTLYPLIHSQIHKCVLSKHNSLFYKIENDQIIIIACWDNRKDPERLRI